MTNRTAAAAKPRTRKIDEPAAPPPAMTGLAETAVQLVPYGLLQRAPENVRHTREHEDVLELADDIAGHGLLQSLIGYQTEDLGQTWTWIVGGGRRLAALALLHTRALLDDSYKVPVLIRSKDEAVELSLAENLARRTMSPVDEFLAFQHMRAHGADEAGLAKRFGFSERYVKQRLRLAGLHSEILGALSERQITIDAAMAYASSQNTDLQLRVFRAQVKSTWKPHDPDMIRRDLSTKAHHSADPVATFVGAAAYQAAGGRYEDDLFTSYAGPDAPAKLIDTALVERLAREKMSAELIPFVSAANANGAGINGGAIIAPDLDVSNWNWTMPKAPAGLTLIDCRYDHEKKRWNAARNCGAEVKGIVGLDHTGSMTLVETAFFVSNDKLKEVRPPENREVYRQPTAEEMEARRRTGEIEKWSRRLALGGFAGTPLKGRVFWPPEYQGSSDRFEHPTLGAGYQVYARLFVTQAEADAHAAAAEEKIDQLKAERLAAEEAERRRAAGEDEAHNQRLREIADMDPEPAVIVADDTAWHRWPDGSYQNAPADAGEEGDQGFDELTQLLAEFAAIGAVFATLADYYDRQPGASRDRDPERPDPYDDELDEQLADEDVPA